MFEFTHLFIISVSRCNVRYLLYLIEIQLSLMNCVTLNVFCLWVGLFKQDVAGISIARRRSQYPLNLTVRRRSFIISVYTRSRDSVTHFVHSL